MQKSYHYLEKSKCMGQILDQPFLNILTILSRLTSIQFIVTHIMRLKMKTASKKQTPSSIGLEIQQETSIQLEKKQ